ncbi:unnamed protein product [Spirodela intermedia]|uniref:DYW domain-containing protein n=1 Tax=Spirodela intermedia TaxID=51605 RepID=A0A7I8J8P5_SPIIN|nr:unnamed protein product [Spirodela intermedia]CAA6666430.1 unnamed protein product [Spirodela intermedia]
MARRSLYQAADPAASPTASLPHSSYAHIRRSHALLLKSGDLASDDRLASKLLSFYSSLCRFPDAVLLLDDIRDPDPFCFSNLISALSKSPSVTDASSALALFRRMLRGGLPPDRFVLPSVLKACAALQSDLAGPQVHALASVSGCAGDSFVQTSLVHLYLRCDRTLDAQRVFERMTNQSVVSWSAMVGGYARSGCVAEALRTFDLMRASGVEPNRVTWNGMIAGFSTSGLTRESARALRKMHSEGSRPDGSTVSSVLPAIADLEDGLAGMQAHAYIIKCNLESDDCVVTALVAMYGKCRLVEEMLRAFGGIGRKMEVGACNALGVPGRGVKLNVISWTSIVACCSQNAEDTEALDLFGEMQAAGVRPNSVTISCVLPACANIAALGHGRSVHGFSIRNGMSEGVYVGSSLVDMYAKCGRIGDARRVFEAAAPSSRNVVSWNAMLGGYAMHGKAREAVELFDLMRMRAQKPDSVTFTCLLAACSQAGLLEQGLRYFETMSEDHGIAPRMEHYACVVSLLGRAGKLERAYALTQKMSLKPDACLHGDVALGEIAARKLFELEPGNVGNYVLLSNIYAAKGMRGGVDGVRDMMRAMAQEQVAHASRGDQSHPQMTQILERLEKLSVEMRKLGHQPSTDLVLQDVEEQDKEHILCGHSEKLAVALGLLSTPPGTPLRVIKNLRICIDCHSVVKFISRFEMREIFVRDTNRFHHFKDGECSCGDYW